MHVGCTNPNFDYFMNGEKLMETTSEQDIGVLIDKSLKLSYQCITAARVANAGLSKICQAFHIQQVTNARKVISEVFVLQCTVFGRKSKHKTDVTA